MIRTIHQVAADRPGGMTDFGKSSIQKGKGERYVTCYKEEKNILYYDSNSPNGCMYSYTGT